MSKYKCFSETMDNEVVLFESFERAKEYSQYIFEKYGYGFRPRIYPIPQVN